MILTRSPLRITLGGGGTDFPAHYREHGGLCVTAAIDKYVYVAIQDNFDPGLIVKYSEVERCAKPVDVKHPLIREALRLVGIDGGIEIVSMADVPAGTGLGSSGSFTTALVAALRAHKRDQHKSDRYMLAEDACNIEIDGAGIAAGKQDQYAAAFGGIQRLEFRADWIDGDVEPVQMSDDVLHSLEESLMLFYTGIKRSSSEVLVGNHRSIAQLKAAAKLAEYTVAALEDGNLSQVSNLLDESWQEKNKTLSSPEIDEMYCLGRKHGATAGKLVGAGKGGFMLFFTENRTRLRASMTDAGYRELPFRFDWEGTTRVI